MRDAAMGSDQWTADGGGSGKLEENRIFQLAAAELSHVGLEGGSVCGRPRLPLNLVVYDGANRLYVWNSQEEKLHYVQLQDSDALPTSSDSRFLLAAKIPKTVLLSTRVTFPVHFLALNRVGRSLVLVGSSELLVVDTLPQVCTTSEDNPVTGVCRASLVGVDRIFQAKNVHSLRILQVSWHPYSDTHLGVLSSDGIFRLFDLSVDKERAEQEYHLQPSSVWRPGMPFARPVSFAFGGEHLWDHFTVFFAFGDGSMYCLCPVVPFGSLYSSAAVEELAKDAGQWSSLADSTAAGNASLALAWLESVFPGLPLFQGPATVGDSAVMRKACAHVRVDASVALQGPFTTVWSGDVLSTKSEDSDEAKQVGSLLYNTIGKDSIFALCGFDGHIYLYALADEVQPMWNPGVSPRLVVDDDGHLLSVGMISEGLEKIDSRSAGKQITLNAEEAVSTIWTGQTPPLLQLAVIDLALSEAVLEAAPPFLLADPVVPERLYCCHAGGLDAILLQWLPFSDQSRHGVAVTTPPVVFPVLDTYCAGNAAPLPLLGVAAYLDSFGEIWLISVTFGGLCAVVEMTSHKANALYVDGTIQDDKEIEKLTSFSMISRDLLQGPKDIPIAQVAASGLKLTLDSIEGRSILHDQCKLLHEKYIEYAHRVYVELTSHANHLKEIIGQQQSQLHKLEEELSSAASSCGPFADRVQQACQKNQELQERIKLLSTAPALRQKPLTIAERDLKDLFDRMTLQDLDVLQSAVDVLKSRSEHVSRQHSHRQVSPQGVKIMVPDSQMRRLKLAVDKLSDTVEDMSKKVKVVDESVKHREILLDR